MIPLCEPLIEGNEWKYVKECLDSGWVSSVGKFVDDFEQKFSEYVGAETTVVTMNGTSAIALALQTLGIGPGDEVIVPSVTFIASVNPVKYVGAEPVFVDITGDTWVMDVDKIEGVITSKTKAIIPVHLYGNVVDMDPLLKLAKRYGLYVIEDATEALGSEYKTADGYWHKAGTLGDFGVFSFNGNKLITTGAGGMLVSQNKQLGSKAKYLSNQAKTSLDNGGFFHKEIGYNYRMPNLLAAMGLAQLERIHIHIEKKGSIARIYNRLLSGTAGIKLPVEKENVKHVQWLYGILVDEEKTVNRDQIIEYLKNNGVSARPFFAEIHLMPPYQNMLAGSLEVSTIVSRRGLSLPSSVSLTEDEISLICRLIQTVKSI